MIFLNQLLSTKNYINYNPIYKLDKVMLFGEHEKVSILPYEFTKSSAVVFRDEIHILGSGITANQRNHYKWDGNTWVSVSILPFEFHGSAIVYNNEIHILSGSSGSINHYKWNGVSWSSVSTLPCNAYQRPAVVYNNEIHLISGDDYKSHYKWDGSWSKVDELPITATDYNAVVCKNEIHIITSGTTNNHYKWNGEEWSLDITTPYKFTKGSLAVLNDEIHILGGDINGSCIHNDYRFNGTSWGESGWIPHEFAYGSAVVYHCRIHVLGGKNSAREHYILKTYARFIGVLLVFKDSFVYSKNYEKNSDSHIIPMESLESLDPVFVYNKSKTKLLCTNQEIKYNSDSGKYEIYGYFPTTLKGTTVPITSDGWQTLQLDTPNLFE